MCEIIKAIDEAAELGIIKVVFTGGGEPTFHKKPKDLERIIKLSKYAKDKGFIDSFKGVFVEKKYRDSHGSWRWPISHTRRLPGNGYGRKYGGEGGGAMKHLDTSV